MGNADPTDRETARLLHNLTEFIAYKEQTVGRNQEPGKPIILAPRAEARAAAARLHQFSPDCVALTKV